MQDEIKEILEYMKQYVEEPNVPDYNGEYPQPWEITIEEVQCILDYITNLQKENEELKKNQRYHKKFGNDYIFCMEGDKETYKDYIFELQEENEDYKSRIEKAIEYIEENQDMVEWIHIPVWELLNILQGVDKE